MEQQKIAQTFWVRTPRHCNDKGPNAHDEKEEANEEIDTIGGLGSFFDGLVFLCTVLGVFEVFLLQLNERCDKFWTVIYGSDDNYAQRNEH